MTVLVNLWIKASRKYLEKIACTQVSVLVTPRSIIHSFTWSINWLYQRILIFNERFTAMWVEIDA